MEEHEYLKKELSRIEKAMNNGFAKLEAKLEILAENYMSRDEIERKLDKKVDKEDFQPFQKVFWTLVTVVVSAIVISGLTVAVKIGAF